MTHTKTGMFKSWQGVKIRQLTDSAVYVPEQDEMAIITVYFKGGEKPRDFVMALDGREIDGVAVNGKRWTEPQEYVESCEVLD